MAQARKCSIKANLMPSFLPLKLLVISKGYIGTGMENFTNMKIGSIYYVKKCYSLVIDMTQKRRFGSRALALIQHLLNDP